jgi:hypothetical protein
MVVSIVALCRVKTISNRVWREESVGGILLNSVPRVFLACDQIVFTR